MNSKTFILIIGIYLAIGFSVCGYFYINPDLVEYGNYTPRDTREDYSNLKSSSIIFGAGLILIYSILQFFVKKNDK